MCNDIFFELSVCFLNSGGGYNPLTPPPGMSLVPRTLGVLGASRDTSLDVQNGLETADSIRTSLWAASETKTRNNAFLANDSAIETVCDASRNASSTCIYIYINNVLLFSRRGVVRVRRATTRQFK